MPFPYGVDTEGHVVVLAGHEVIDLSLADGLSVDREVFRAGLLNPFMDLGPDAWAITQSELEAVAERQSGSARRPLGEVSLVLPWEIGDFSDFYASRQHVETMGRMLRPGEDPLPAAWLDIPIGYHGRAGTVIVSGEPVYRPAGVRSGTDGPLYGPSERLDVEVELGFLVGSGVVRGRTLKAIDADRHIFGVVILNDWSARDIQAFEYRPLGPFLGKSFATSVSAWVTPWSALQSYRVPGPPQHPLPVSYLRVAEPRNVDVELVLSVNGRMVSKVSSSSLYWSAAQQLSHLTANGAGVRTGDLFATGAISGPDPEMNGSLMEQWEGRRWLADGDCVRIEGRAGSLSLGIVEAEVVAGCPIT